MAAASPWESLPHEILRQIFTHVYPPWYLRYTQDHDSLTTSVAPTLMGISLDRLYEVPPNPRFLDIPGHEALLVCRTWYVVAQEILRRSFTGHVHIESRLRYSDMHDAFAGIMSNASILTMHYLHLWTFWRLMMLKKMKNLKKIVILTPDTNATSSLRFQLEGINDNGSSSSDVRYVDQQLGTNLRDHEILRPLEIDSSVRASGVCADSGEWLDDGNPYLPPGELGTTSAVTTDFSLTCYRQGIFLTWRSLFTATCGQLKDPAEWFIARTGFSTFANTSA